MGLFRDLYASLVYLGRVHNTIDDCRTLEELDRIEGWVHCAASRWVAIGVGPHLERRRHELEVQGVGRCGLN